MSEIEKQCDDQEILFVESYLTHLQKARAARDAGHSEHTARQIGYEVYNRPHVKKLIELKLAERTISAAETQKLISDTASANLTDYYRPVKTMKVPQERRGLQQVIDHIQYKLEIETEFMAAAGLSDAEKKVSSARIRDYELEITRLDIELNKNPLAYRIVDGDPILVDEMQLDLDALVADKEKGKVKKIKYGKDGLEIEMYAADAAQDKLARMHGLYANDNKITIVEQPLFGEQE